MTESKNCVEFWRARDKKAAEMRAAGMTWRQIADALNMQPQGASKAAQRHEARQAAEAE